MTVLTKNSDIVKWINNMLQEWHQGDLALAENWFGHFGIPTRPLTEIASKASGDGIKLLESRTHGLAVITQTCDIVRDCLTRPFIEVSPLIQVDSTVLYNVKKCRFTSYVTLPCLEANRLVIDLDRVMTVEKSIVASWSHTQGCSNDSDVRILSQALARKQIRFAFPDDFSKLIIRLRDRLIQRHGKSSEEGNALRSLKEIRVHANPSWYADEVDLQFWFISDDDIPIEESIIEKFRIEWLELVSTSGRFKNVNGQNTTLDMLTAKEYTESAPLDLDYLSMNIR
ncbi:MAG: hypothetical protein LBR22_02755 [Desulfovibrio sp.]|jgi:hypothetical protein|nr:hypothetical protein [Desulfovibrio sp.]